LRWRKFILIVIPVLWGWGQAVAEHDFVEGFGVGRGWGDGGGCGLEDGGDLAEVVVAEDAGVKGYATLLFEGWFFVRVCALPVTAGEA